MKEEMSFGTIREINFHTIRLINVTKRNDVAQPRPRIVVGSATRRNGQTTKRSRCQKLKLRLGLIFPPPLLISPTKQNRQIIITGCLSVEMIWVHHEYFIDLINNRKDIIPCFIGKNTSTRTEVENYENN